MKTGLLSAAFVLALGAATAQSLDNAATPAPGVKWSLDDCIGYAQRNNIDVQKTALTVEQGNLDLSTAKYSRLPDLNASVGYDASFGRGTSSDNTTKDGTVHSGSFGVSASLPLFEGFKINRQIKGGKLDLEAASQDLSRAGEDVAVNVMSLYLKVLYNKEMVGIAERQLELSTQQTVRSRELFGAGKQPESTIYESEAVQANDALNLTQARSDLQLALLDLSQALNRESASGFDVVEPPMDALLTSVMQLPAQSPDAVYDFAVVNRPHIRAEQIRLESSQNAVGIARSSLYPTLSLGGGYGTGVYSNDPFDSSFGTQFRTNSREYLQLSLRIPIFNRRATRNNIHSAQLAARKQQLTLTDAELSLRKQIEQAWYNADAAQAKFRSATAASASAEKAFAFEQEKAAAGRSTIFDFNDAKTRMLKAQSELAQSKYEMVFRRKILDYYKGEPLRL